MVEQFISKRVLFPYGEQQKFLDKVLETISVKETAKLCSLSERTIRDWRREKFLMNSKAVETLCQKFNLPFPLGVELKNRYWYASKGASKGGKSVVEKYGRVGGDPKYRIKRWREWWESGGKQESGLKKFSEARPIQKPNHCKELAEFIGIVLGDGGMSDYQVVITLHAVDDKTYGKFVCSLIKKLFQVPIGIYPSKKDAVIDYAVSRVELVRFLEKLGLKRGNKVKQRVNIPDWVKKNKKYSIACVRGLIDTDGCVFTHKYKVKGKEYSYKKLLFTSRSEPLRQSVFQILQEVGIRARLDNGYDVRIDSKEEMKKYFQVVGSHNPKHLKRYQN